MKKHNRRRIVLFTALGLIAALALGIFLYVQDYFHALPEAQAIADRMEKVGKDLVFLGETDRGIMLYPGGKVDEAAYAPLAEMLHDGGDTVVIAHMPLRLAIFDTGRAAKIMEEFPDIAEWYIVGHSLGGTAASMFVADSPDAVAGIAFLGSYPYKDLSDYDGKVISIVGSEDGVLNREKATEAIPLYPADANFVTLEGANHAGYGAYGSQSGDGNATISPAEQQRETSWLLLDAFE